MMFVLVNLFIYFPVAVAMCCPVLDVKTMYDTCLLLTSSGNLY